MRFISFNQYLGKIRYSLTPILGQTVKHSDVPKIIFFGPYYKDARKLISLVLFDQMLCEVMRGGRLYEHPVYNSTQTLSRVLRVHVSAVFAVLTVYISQNSSLEDIPSSGVLSNLNNYALSLYCDYSAMQSTLCRNNGTTGVLCCV